LVSGAFGGKGSMPMAVTHKSSEIKTMKDSLLNCTIRKTVRFPKMVTIIVAGGSVLLVGACEKPPSQAVASPPPAEQNRAGQLPTGLQFKQRQIAFLNRIRDADPQKRVIDHAMLNEQNELGVILDRTVELNRIPDLMRTLLTQMAGEFPGQDLIVIAYTPSNPPRKVGTAYLDSRTKQMNYVPEY
jgi:hypothetical protein